MKGRIKMQANQNPTIPSYITYPRQFAPYKWYKPLLASIAIFGALIVMMLAFIAVSSVLVANQGYDINELLSGNYYDTLDAYSPLGALLSLGSVAIMLPAVALGNRIVNARPFSSISSSRGGFSFGAFFKCIAAALVLVGIPLTLINLFTEENTGNIRFTALGFIICTLLVPLQCIAEEYMFRGHIMQTFGSWFKLPVIAIVLQTACFAAAHPYNVVGVISVSVMGIILGICAYITKGLEAGCALHIVNNMMAFYFAGFGIGRVKSDVEIIELIVSIVIFGLYLAFIIFADKKLGWFSKVKKDDLTPFNERAAAKK